MNKLLDARDRRQEMLEQALSEGHRAVVFLSLNVPGVDKTPRGTAALFSWAMHEIQVICAPFQALAVSQDALGHFAIIASGRDPLEVKKVAVALEESHPAARLVDLDVYCTSEQLGRRELGLPARPCLLCDQAAVDCMRLKRHVHTEIITKAHELLSNFSA